jgi:hypothetical protein
VLVEGLNNDTRMQRFTYQDHFLRRHIPQQLVRLLRWEAMKWVPQLAPAGSIRTVAAFKRGAGRRMDAATAEEAEQTLQLHAAREQVEREMALGGDSDSLSSHALSKRPKWHRNFTFVKAPRRRTAASRLPAGALSVGMRMMMESRLSLCQTESARLHTMVQLLEAHHAGVSAAARGARHVRMPSFDAAAHTAEAAEAAEVARQAAGRGGARLEALVAVLEGQRAAMSDDAPVVEAASGGGGVGPAQLPASPDGPVAAPPSACSVDASGGAGPTSSTFARPPPVELLGRTAGSEAVRDSPHHVGRLDDAPWEAAQAARAADNGLPSLDMED